MILIAVAAGIALGLGSAHLALTFVGSKLKPRPPELEEAMRQARLGITRETTMWRAWLGFNVTHSLGLMLFGLVFGYLALEQPELLRGSGYLQALGLGALAAYSLLARLYFFSVPRRWIQTATALYALGVVWARLA